MILPVTSRNARSALLPALLSLLIVLAAGWFSFAEAPAGETDLYLGHGADPQAFVWFTAWFPYAWHHHLPLFWTDHVSAPTGMSLAWRTSIPALALLGAPMTSFGGALGSYDLLMRMAPGLLGAGLLFAARSFGATWPAAVVAGLLGVFCSYETGQSLAHINLSFTVCVPLLIGLGVLAARRQWQGWQLALPAGLVLGFQIGISQEVAATSALAACGTLLFLWWRRPIWRPALRALLPGLAGGLVVAILVASPLLWAMMFGGGRQATVIDDPSHVSTDLLNLLVPGDAALLQDRWSRRIFHGFTSNPSENGGYLGLPLLLLLGWIRWRGGSATAALLVELGALAAILSLGPRLHVAGHVVGPAPWALVSWLPILDDMLPARFMLYAACAFALAVACWLTALGRRRLLPAGLAIAAALVTLLPDRAMLGHWEQLTTPAVLAALPENSAVFVLPYAGDHVGPQAVSGLRYRLVGQGYLGGGIGQPFSQWPMMDALYDARYAQVDPVELATFLQLYGAERVVVLPDRAHDPRAAEDLLRAAGWRQDGAVFVAARPTPPHDALLAARDTYFVRRIASKRLERETMNACAIRRLERRLGISLLPVWAAYRTLFTLPVAPERITCP